MTQPASSPPSIRPGGLIAGKYRIDSMLGEGGMGTVWAATHTGLGQPVALKLISSELARSPDLLSRFKAEAKAAAQLQSRYVVRMYDSGVTEDGRPYIAMEFLRGESLEDRLNRLGALPLAATVRIVSQVCKALKLAHSQGIIHRDLKPANIFIATTGDDEEVAKVLDFGIAKMLDHERDHGATATGIILGTPLYMSPEQARALKTLDHRSDLYSLGMVTYRMLVGDPPFQGESFGDLVYSICTKPLPSLHQQVPSLPPALDAWFQTACAKDQNARFATAEQLAEALWAASGLSSGQLGELDTGGHPAPSSLAHTPITAQSALHPSALNTGGSRPNAQTLAGNQANTTGGTAVPLDRPRSTPPWAVMLGAAAIGLAALAGAFVWMTRGSSDEDGLTETALAEPVPTPQAAQPEPADEAARDDGVASPVVNVTQGNASAIPTVTPAAAATEQPKEQTDQQDQRSATEGTSGVAKRPTWRKPKPEKKPAKEPDTTEKPASAGKGTTPDMGF